MNGFKDTLKRLLGNKNTVTIIGIILCGIVLYFGYKWRINERVKTASIPFAKVTIQPRTKITADMIDMVDVPINYIKGNYISSSSLIIGQFSNYNTTIPKGSLFYKDVVVDEDSMPDYSFGEVPEGYTLISYPVTLESTYGNSMYPGNYVNMYFKALDDDDKLMFGKFIKNIKVLDVKDSSGRHVFENSEESRIPAYMLFALPEEMHLLLRKSLYLRSTVSAELMLVPVTETLTEDKNAVTVSSTQIEEFILSKTVMVAEEDLPNVSDPVENEENEENE